MSRIDAMQARVLKARRISYVFRRVDENFQQNPETTNETEMAVLEGQGISAFLYFQRTDDRKPESDKQARDFGIEDGGLALAACRVVGYPMGMPVFFPNGSDAYFGGLWEAMGDAHPFGVIGAVHKFWMREETNGTGEARDLDRLQMA